MITHKAAQALERMLRDALKSALGVSEDQWTVSEAKGEAPGRDVVILTVSSYLFRMMTIVHFDEDEATWQHFHGGDAPPPGERDSRQLQDRIAEFGNVACGAFNRELARVVPHVGMSTPNVVDKQCVAFLASLGGAGLQKHLQVQLSDGLVLHARLHVLAYGELDFDMPAPQAEEAELTGELEMF